MQLRRMRKHGGSLDRQPDRPDDQPGIMEVILEAEERRLFQKHFERLSPECQQILGMFFEGKSMEEIRKNLGLSSVGYAKKRKFVCKERLIKAIQSDPLYLELKQRSA